jgi:hypothetical protein
VAARPAVIWPVSRNLPPLKQLLLPALRGARANLLPALVLQAFALAIVLGYSQWGEFKHALDQVGEFKRQAGYSFSLLSTLVFGGLIPFGILLLAGKVPAGERRAQLVFYLAFWAWKGIEVDAFYRAQALLFGDESSPRVIATKTLVDQFVYNPLWAAPTQTLFFLWKDSQFSLTKTRQALRNEAGFGPFGARLLTVLVATWAVWIPAVSIIYSLPSALQLPLFNLVLCFWCLLLSFVSRSAPLNVAHLR